jgi:hypothetical protein
MEFDIGTLLYIVVTIIALIASVVGKKKNPSSSESTEGQQKTGFFGKLEEELGNLAAEAKKTTEQVIYDGGYDDDEVEVEVDEAENYLDHRDGEVSYAEEVDETPVSAYSNFEGIYNSEKRANAELIESEVIRSNENDDILNVIDLEETDHPDYFEIVKDFDLGTAVVYSTIINRKEY